MKKYLFIALAALGFAACAEKVDDTNVPKGELEESYIAINLMAADADTRAPLDEYGGFEDGTQPERAVKTAYFFFFDENGNPFNVLGSTGGATAPGGEKNHLSLTIGAASGNDQPNVSDIKNAVLVLNTYKGVYPSKIVAVLNWSPSENLYSLDALHDKLATLGSEAENEGFVMSNSVYMNSANKMVDAVAITEDNIKKTAEDAYGAPINIYVERIAAKVVLTAGGKISTETDDIIFKVTEDNAFVPVGGTGTTVYMKLYGWELYNDYPTSTLLKNIDTSWSVDGLGLTWNDSPYYRCYWAQSQSNGHNDSFQWAYDGSSFPTTYGFKIATEDNYVADTYTYCGENTNQYVEGAGSDLRTKVILKGQLCKHNGTDYEPLTIGSWYGNNYAGIEDLKKAVANSLKYVLYSSENGTDFTSITYNDIECVRGVSGTESYEVGFQLSSTGQGKTWYKKSSEGEQVLGGDISNKEAIISATNEYLAENVEPALVYEDGKTYYFVDIKHLGTAGAEYGVVRNHVYQIDINKISGYGSPVYGEVSFIKPEYPETYNDSFVAAKINVLSWKVVKQTVNVGQ